MVFDLSTEDLGGGLVGELDDVGHAVDEHPLVEQVFVEGLSLILDAGLLELLKMYDVY